MIQNVGIVKYREKPPLLCKICRIGAILLGIFKIAVIVLNLFGYFLYVGSIPQAIITLIFDGLLIFCGILSLPMRRKEFFILPLIAGVVAMLIYSTSLFSYIKNTTYQSFSSPNSAQTIVLKSNGYLFSGETTFYKKPAPIFLKKTGVTLKLDEGYQAVSSAKIEAIWESDMVIFNYYDKNSGELIFSKEVML